MGIWYAGRMKYRFHDLELDAGRGLLRRDGEEVDLEPRAFAVLSFLVAHRDRVVSKDELVEAVWDGRFVSDDAISTAVKAVRRAVNDSGAEQNSVRTLRGRGFRFVAPVEVVVAAEVAAASIGDAIVACSHEAQVQDTAQTAAEEVEAARQLVKRAVRRAMQISISPFAAK